MWVSRRPERIGMIFSLDRGGEANDPCISFFNQFEGRRRKIRADLSIGAVPFRHFLARVPVLFAESSGAGSARLSGAGCFSFS
jgi:hypothetical protein